jgi:hypothetical protein
VSARTRRSLAAAVAAVAAAALAAACSPRAPQFSGAPVPARLPAPALPAGHRKLVFTFSYKDPDVSLKGEAVARTAAPDSVRLDFFVNNEAVGDAVIIGDSVIAARPKLAKQLLPPLPFVWAALGIFRVPPAADTAARVDSDTLRIEIAGHVTWRAAYLGPELVRLDQIDDGRIPQSVVRVPGVSVRFRAARAGRTLDLTVGQVDTLPPFDASIWR